MHHPVRQPTLPGALREALGDASEIQISRSAETAEVILVFSGWTIGHAADGTGSLSGLAADWTRRVDVTIYLTEAGAIATQIATSSRWIGESDQVQGDVHASPADAWGWFQERIARADRRQTERNAALAGRRDAAMRQRLYDQAGALRRAVRTAWEDASAALPELAEHLIRRID